MALRAQSNQQQVACFDCPGEIGDCDLMMAFPAPDIREKLFFAVTGDGCPEFSCRNGKFRNGFN